MKNFYTALLILTSVSISFGQSYKKLHHGINKERTNSYNPKLTADGKSMLYSTDLDDPRKELNFFTSDYYGNERWAAPQKASDVLNFGKVQSFGGYFISYDDNTLLFTSRRTRGVGGFDIWIANKKGDGWDTPKNLGKPFNSEGHEGDPSLSPDGNEMYFCKCATMSNQNATGCKIVVSEKRGSGYGAPQDLPGTINTGNSMSPLILADGKTLIFASDKMGGKGGLDLFMTRKEGGDWSKPKPMTFMNTSGDDRYLSIPARGDVAYYSVKEEEYNVIVKSKIPEELQQLKIMWLRGTVNMMDGYAPAVQVVDLTAGETSMWPIDNAGNYSIFLAEGSEYDLSVRDGNGKYWFTTDYYDLRKMDEIRREAHKTNVVKVNTGQAVKLKSVMFDKNYNLTAHGKEEIDRVTHILQKNPNWKLNITTVFDTYKEDSIKSSSDMIYTIRDTTIKVNVSYDSIVGDSGAIAEVREIRDTVQKIKTTYHNDHSKKLKTAVEDYLNSKKIPSKFFSVGIKVEEGENKIRPGYALVEFN